jgi:hypothetical protein
MAFGLATPSIAQVIGGAVDNPNEISSESTVRVELCFRLKHSFRWHSDHSSFSPPYKAKGIHFRLEDPTGQVKTLVADPETGCRRTKIRPQTSYAVIVESRATLTNDNTVLLMDHHMNENLYEWTAPENLFVYGPGTIHYEWPTTTNDGNPENISTIMAALTKTLDRRAITEDETYRVYRNSYPPELDVPTDAQGVCGEHGGACFSDTINPGFPAVWLQVDTFPENTRDQFSISHEIGHYGLYLLLDEELGRGNHVGSATGDTRDYSLPVIPGITSTCADGVAGHSAGNADYPMGTEEWGNTAFIEGFAHYYSVTVWNKRNHQSCDYRNLNCSGQDRAIDYCYTDVGLRHTPTTGFELDWVKFFWQSEHTDGGCGIAFSTIIDIIKDANPTAWTDNAGPLFLAAMAPTHLSGTDLECIQNKIVDRLVY